MENPIEKYIDSLKRKRIKTSLSLIPKDDKSKRDKMKAKIEKEYKYDRWLPYILSIKLDNEYFPQSNEEIELYDLLIMKVAYNKNFKFLSDRRHPLIYNFLEKLKFTEFNINKCIELSDSINIETLDYYDLFKDELELEKIQFKIDEFATDSSYGTIISHSPKMTNPSCRYPKIFYEGYSKNDGFLRTGNVAVNFDMQINAIKLKIFKFLSLKYRNITLLEYIKNNDINTFIKLFNISEDRAKSWIKLFSLPINSQDYRTDRYIKQIYFPFDDNYHLLSLVHPSGLLFALKEKIDYMNRNSSNTYIGRKEKSENIYSKRVFYTVPNLTEIKYGGEHPKNISGLNNKHQSHYLLSSMPPKLTKQDIRFPKNNFFTESINPWKFKYIFDDLHNIFKVPNYSNVKMRDARKYHYGLLVEKIIEQMWNVREVEQEQYFEKTSKLKTTQKIWLLSEFELKRDEEDAWLDEVIEEITHWVLSSYKKVLKKSAIEINGTEELKDIKKIVEEHKEGLR